MAAGLGKLDLAFEYLDKAYEERDALMGFIHVYTPWVAPNCGRTRVIESCWRK